MRDHPACVRLLHRPAGDFFVEDLSSQYGYFEFVGSDPEYNDVIFGADFAADGRLATTALDGSLRRALASFAGQRVHAVAGIGDPERFFSMLRAAGSPRQAASTSASSSQFIVGDGGGVAASGGAGHPSARGRI